MAINVNVKAGGVEPLVKPGQELDMAALMGESSVEQAQPTTQPRQSDFASEADLADPSLRSASPNQAQVAQQVQETQFDNPETVAQVEAEAAEQRQAPLTEVMDGMEASQLEQNSPFGAAIERADRFSTMFQDKLESGASVQGAYLGQQQTQELLHGATPEQMGHDPLSMKSVLLDPNGLDAGMITPEGLTVVDPHFARVAGFTTEQFMSGALQAEEDAATGFEQEAEVNEEGELVSRGMGNAQLGREIFKQWKRDQNYALGNPTDQYDTTAMTNDQYEVLGLTAKEMYAAANPDMMKRESNGERVEFQLTPVGAANIRHAKRAMPDAFINNEIPPSAVPKAALEKHGQGEQRRNIKGKTTAVVNRKLRQVEEAKTNMNSVSHVVDPLRRKIFFALAIDVLSALKSGQPIPKHADLFDIGPTKFKYFKGEAEQKNQTITDPNKKIDPKKEYQNYVNKFLETMNTAARYSGKNNHLDFAVQELQSRMHVEQTRFNPQGNPWLRFITGGAKAPSFKIGGGSEAELMFKELMAVHFLDGGNLLPEQRIKAFNQDWNNPNGRLRQMAQQGNATGRTLLSPQEDAQTTGMMSQIRLTPQGINVPPALQNTKKLEVNQSLLNHAAEEGIEGLSLIEAAIELGRYADAAHDSNFTTNIGVEFDGKTHGPATNMMQLGIERGGYRVGVLREKFSDKKLGDFYHGSSGTIRSETFSPGPSSLAQTRTTRDKDGMSTAWEDYIISSGKGSPDPNTSGGFPAADYIDNASGERVEVKGFKSNYGPNFYMTEATMNNMRNKIEKGLIDVIEVTRQHNNKDGTVTVDVAGRIPADEFLQLVEPATDAHSKKYNYGYMVPNMETMAKDKQKEGDIRIGMKNYMLENGQADFANFLNEEVAAPMYRILQEAVKDKGNFLKKSPMTLGYGQLMSNLVGHVQTTVYSGPRSGQIKEIIKDNRALFESVARSIYDPNAGEKRQQTAEEVVIEALHSIMSDSINVEMDPEVVQIGQLLRANNVVAMMSDEIISIDNALGFKTYIGAKQTTMKEEKARLPITRAGGKQVGDAPLYTSAPSGSAVRDFKPGGWGRGRIIPAVIQGLDGAWMNRMFTDRGGSWSQLKGNYMLPIMDAVKTDLAGARKIREHANKNWWKGIEEWSYVDQVMGNWGPGAINRFRTKLEAMDPATELDLGPDSPYRGVGWLFATNEKGVPTNLIDTIYDTFDKPTKPTNMTVEQFEAAQKDRAKAIAKQAFPEKALVAINETGTVTPEQMLFLFNRMVKVLDLESRNKQAVSKTTNNRNKLFNKVKQNRNEILQIDLG